MNYYRYKCDGDVYHSLNSIDSDIWDRVEEFDGRPLAASWRPIHVCCHRRALSGNFPFLASEVPVFDNQARDALAPLVGPYVEMLPLIHNELGEGALYAVNVLVALDCLDDRSVVRRFEEGNIMAVEKYVFRRQVIGDVPIFRIKEIPHYGVYVGEAFRERVEAAGLRGLAFEPL